MTDKTTDMVNYDHKKILDFIKTEFPAYSANVLDTALRNTIYDHAFQLTAYEKNGCISETDMFHYLAVECEPVTVEQMNAYHELNNDYDSWIYGMDEFNEVMHDIKPDDIACKIQFGEFSIYDDYFSFDGYGNLVSMDDYTFRNETDNGDDIKAALIENNYLESFPESDVSMIRKTLKYKDIIIDTALYMVSLGY